MSEWAHLVVMMKKTVYDKQGNVIIKIEYELIFEKLTKYLKGTLNP